MKRLMKKLMLSCKKATELIEKKLSNHLNPLESVQLFFHLHLLVCTACRRYEEQSRLIESLLAKRHDILPSLPIIPVSEEFKERVRKSIIGDRG